MRAIDVISLPERMKEAAPLPERAFIDEKIMVPPAVREFAKGRKYYIKTFGCQANVRDEEIIAGLLEKAGFQRTSKANCADFALVNTCAVRDNAERKAYGRLGILKAVKERKKDLIVALGGCMSQERSVVDEIMSRYPFVDIVLGTHNIVSLLDLIAVVLKDRVRVVDVKSSTGAIRERLPSARLSSVRAYVNVTYGCDNFCTFCIVPYTRGRLRSRRMEDVVKECEDLGKRGYKEVTLLGQNVDSYGKDLYGKPSFAALLDKVADVGIPRVRFLTSYPSDFTSELIDVMRKHPNVMDYVHLPVQSGSDEVLKRMNRRYDVKKYLSVVDELRAKIPDVSLSTDIIVGFPNETREEFEKTLELVRKVRYDSAFTFIYSPRPGTPAAAVRDTVSRTEKLARFKALTKALEDIIAEKSGKMVGRTYEVLVEGTSDRDKSMLSGYTEGNKLVHFPGGKDLIGKIVKVRIRESHVYSLIGELVPATLEEALHRAGKSLLEEPSAKRFLALRKKVEESAALQALIKEKARCEQEFHHAGGEIVPLEKARAALRKVDAALAADPLYANYQAAREELLQLLDEVRDYLEES